MKLHIYSHQIYNHQQLFKFDFIKINNRYFNKDARLLLGDCGNVNKVLSVKIQNCSKLFSSM